MPHIIIEHNDVVLTFMSVEHLTDNIHQAAIAHDALPAGGIRTRSYCADIARVGDGAPENGFIYITVRLGQSRAEAVRKDIGETLFAVLKDFTQAHFDANNPLSIGLEIQEIEKNWTWKQNNIHQILKEKSRG